MAAPFSGATPSSARRIVAPAQERTAMPEPLEAIHIGMTGRREVVVTRELTVGGHVASALAIAPHLPPGWVSVGSEVNIRHLAPTPIGRTVVATARVIAIEGRSVLFAVEAHDGERKIGEGTHRRGAVNLERFAERYRG
jgi:predicted thioesterase